MDPLMQLALLGTASGLAVMFSTYLARQLPGPAGGIVAASPITPTVAVLSLNEDAGPSFLLSGLPTVAGALAAIVLLGLTARWQKTPMFWLCVCSVPLAGAAMTLLDPVWFWPTLGALLAMATLLHRRIDSLQTARGKPLPYVILFAVGAGAILLVHWSKVSMPALAPLAAMAPVLFLASWIGSFLDGGYPRALRIACGAVAGCIGVTAFALAHAVTDSLIAAWAAFGAAALLWQPLLSAPTPRVGVAVDAAPLAQEATP